MTAPLRTGVLLLGLTALAGRGLAAQKPANDLPSTVTDSVVADGKRLFHGAGKCAGCHAAAGVGTRRGPRLDDQVWLHGTGDYFSILEQIVHGVGHPTAATAPMPALRMGTLSYREARAVAAYVWTLSHSRPKPR